MTVSAFDGNGSGKVRIRERKKQIINVALFKRIIVCLSRMNAIPYTCGQEGKVKCEFIESYSLFKN